MAKKISLGKRITLDAFSKLNGKMVEEHKLRTLFWECTLRCNAACKHCGSDCKVSADMKDMPIADFIKVVDGILPHVDPHKTFIIFTGGECLVRRDLEQAGRELNRREFPWGIVSNGILMDRKRFASLRAAGMHAATISLDGFKEEHNWLRGNPVSFDRAVEAIKIMAEDKNFIFDVVTCANMKNFDTLRDFKEFLISIGVKEWRIFTIFPVGRAALYPEFQLSDEYFTKLMEFIVETRKEGRIGLNYGCEGFLGGYELEVRDHPFHCAAGVSVASVLADGSISACPSIRADYHQGNIYKDDFWTVWNQGFKQYRDRGWMKEKGECSDCKMFKYCHGNGMHLRDENGRLLVCHYKRLTK
jgi:radical SAM additional 4Fe4S-binding domain